MGIPVEEFDATDGVLPTGVPVTLDVRGKRVVIPTGDEAVQIGRNEWQKGTGNGSTPWGGAKEFSSPPDNLPGTVRLIGGDNCYLMSVDQSVKSKVLHSGYLSEKGALTFDTEAHMITLEASVENDSLADVGAVISVRVPDTITSLELYNYVDSVYILDETATFTKVSYLSGAENGCTFGITVLASTVSQFKIVIKYGDDGKATIELADDDDLATGLQHMRYPVIIIYDEATSVVDYYVSTGYLNSFKYTQDENGDISSIEIDPGNSIVYHGQTFHSGTSQDGDADGIPDFLEIGQLGSVLDCLKYNDFTGGRINVSALILTTADGKIVQTSDMPTVYVIHGSD